MGHWHYGHNVSGYLPEAEIGCADDWAVAMRGLVSDLELAWDDEYATDEQYLEAHTEMHNATEGQDFLTYTATHADSEHDIPTAWWLKYAADTSGCEDDE